MQVLCSECEGIKGFFSKRKKSDSESKGRHPKREPETSREAQQLGGVSAFSTSCTTSFRLVSKKKGKQEKTQLEAQDALNKEV